MGRWMLDGCLSSGTAVGHGDSDVRPLGTFERGGLISGSDSFGKWGFP